MQEMQNEIIIRLEEDYKQKIEMLQENLNMRADLLQMNSNFVDQINAIHEVQSETLKIQIENLRENCNSNQ